jgi:hypothetical protein
MRASVIVFLYCALALAAGAPGTHAFHPSYSNPTNSALAENARDTQDVAGTEACTPLSGPHVQPSNAVDRAEPFGGRASAAMRGGFGVAEVETPTAGDLPVRGVKTGASTGSCLHGNPERVIRPSNTRVTCVNRRWLAYASSLALRRAGLLSARSTAPAPPVSPQV